MGNRYPRRYMEFFGQSSIEARNPNIDYNFNGVSKAAQKRTRFYGQKLLGDLYTAKLSFETRDDAETYDRKPGVVMPMKCINENKKSWRGVSYKCVRSMLVKLQDLGWIVVETGTRKEKAAQSFRKRVPGKDFATEIRATPKLERLFDEGEFDFKSAKTKNEKPNTEFENVVVKNEDKNPVDPRSLGGEVLETVKESQEFLNEVNSGFDGEFWTLEVPYAYASGEVVNCQTVPGQETGEYGGEARTMFAELENRKNRSITKQVKNGNSSLEANRGRWIRKRLVEGTSKAAAWPTFFTDHKVVFVLPKQSLCYRRIFNRSSVKHGGRFYAHWQNMPSGFRRFLYCNGNATAEYDWSCMHFSILYKLQGLELEGDAYDLKGSWVKKAFGETKARKMAKIAINVLLNAETRFSGAACMAAEFRSGVAEFNSLAWGKKVRFWNDIFDELEKRHPDIDFSEAMGSRLQRRDSELLSEHLGSQGLLGIHDGMIAVEDPRSRDTSGIEMRKEGYSVDSFEEGSQFEGEKTKRKKETKSNQMGCQAHVNSNLIWNVSVLSGVFNTASLGSASPPETS